MNRYAQRYGPRQKAGPKPKTVPPLSPEAAVAALAHLNTDANREELRKARVRAAQWRAARQHDLDLAAELEVELYGHYEELEVELYGHAAELEEELNGHHE